MKVIFNKSAINEAISPLLCAVSGKATISAIDGILIDAKEDGSCILTTFDLEKGMRIRVQGDVKEPGFYIINAQKFSQTLRVMDGDEILLTVNENKQACISSGKSNYKMQALDGRDYPEIPNLVTERGFVLSQAVLRSMLEKVMFAMASNDQRPVLNGCFFHVTDEEMLMVSCDSYKMAKCSVRTDIENKNTDQAGLNYRFIVPTKTVNELYKLLKDDERETVRIYMSRRNIIFNIGDMIFFSRLIDGEYIDYNRIILNTHRIFARIKREPLISALERAALVTEERVAGSVPSHVKLQFEGNLLKISATSSLGSTYDEVDVEHEGEDLLIAFNNRYLINSLRASEADEVTLSMTSALTGINIEPTEKKENLEELFMLLPVRMKEY